MFEPRWVVYNYPTGWNACEECGREHRVWVTSDDLWRLVAWRLRKKRICVRCYRMNVKDARARL